MLSQSITIHNPRGIHLRPTTLILAARNRHRTTMVWLIRESGVRVAMDSSLDLLGMGLTAGTQLTLETDGPDEITCANELAELLQKTYDFH